MSKVKKLLELGCGLVGSFQDPRERGFSSMKKPRAKYQAAPQDWRGVAAGGPRGRRLEKNISYTYTHHVGAADYVPASGES